MGVLQPFPKREGNVQCKPGCGLEPSHRIDSDGARQGGVCSTLNTPKLPRPLHEGSLSPTAGTTCWGSYTLLFLPIQLPYVRGAIEHPLGTSLSSECPHSDTSHHLITSPQSRSRSHPLQSTTEPETHQDQSWRICFQSYARSWKPGKQQALRKRFMKPILQSPDTNPCWMMLHSAQVLLGEGQKRFNSCMHFKLWQHKVPCDELQ